MATALSEEMDAKEKLTVRLAEMTGEVEAAKARLVTRVDGIEGVGPCMRHDCDLDEP